MKSPDIGIALARKIFERRGNNTEIHLTETELAAICGVAADLGRSSALRQVAARIGRQLEVF